MTGVRQAWLVAARELRERSRSGALLVSLGLMILGVVGFIAAPSLLDREDRIRDIGLTGVSPSGLPDAIEAQAESVDLTVRVRRYATVAAGEAAVRGDGVDVLVVDARRIEFFDVADDELRAVVTGAIQLVAVQERAVTAGISPDALVAVLAPVRVETVELGTVSGRSPDDETAALVMALLLFFTITTFGTLVMTGVVEEKSSRVVEVLLARMPARNLLAGKIAGIGLLGFAQVVVTALAALVAGSMVDSFDVPAARGTVLVWAVVWFVLGYALYATVYGALGSLASRSEDAQSIAGPVMVVLVVGFIASFAAIGSPDATWSMLVSLFPPSAPFAMPSRIAMGATAWWEPVLALVLTFAAIAGLVVFAGRVYTGAILHTGPALKLKDAWGRATGGPQAGAAERRGRSRNARP